MRSLKTGLMSLIAAAAISCGPGNTVTPPSSEPCPFNPAIEYVQEQGILSDYDVTGFGTSCEWDPERDQGREPVSFLDEHTRQMLVWMHELDEDSFYTRDQVQSLETRFGKGVIDPETGQRVTRDTGRANQDELLASQDFYEQAKELHAWAEENDHLAPSINPDHYRNFNAWSVRAFRWPFPEPEFDMPLKDSQLEITGLEPSKGLVNYTPVNWGLDEYGTPDYEPQNFIGLEALITGNDAWLVCSSKVEDARAASQNFRPDRRFLWDVHGENVLVQSMLYSDGTVVSKNVSQPPGVSYLDMSLRVEYPVSATLMDLDGEKMTIVYGHISGENGSMDDHRVPDEGDTVTPSEPFAWLNSARNTILLDAQAYVPSSIPGIPGPVRPINPDNRLVDMFFEGYPVHQRPGFNDIRFNRHDTETNYARAIGNRSGFGPCAVDEDMDFIHEPK